MSDSHSTASPGKPNGHANGHHHPADGIELDTPEAPLSEPAQAVLDLLQLHHREAWKLLTGVTPREGAGLSEIVAPLRALHLKHKILGFDACSIVELVRHHPDSQWHKTDILADAKAIWADITHEEMAARAARASLAEQLYDPWQEPVPKAWPAGILSREFEDTIAEIALRDGVDMAGQAMAYITAISGAAPKNATFAAYSHGRFVVRPNIWTMLVAGSGMRKSPMLANAFGALKHRNAGRYRDYASEQRRYEALSPEARHGAIKPEEPHTLIVDDVTIESLQDILARDPRGTLLLKDEIVGMFDFGRYRQGGDGAQSRGFLLSCHDGGSTYVHRKAGGVLIQNAALAVFGCTQPSRLAEFKGLDHDGLLQRFLIVIGSRRVAGGRDDLMVRGQDRLDLIVDRTSTSYAFDYRATPEGSALIRQTETIGGQWAEAADFGLGFPAFARKLHGTHARLALILHLMEQPEVETIPDATIERAGRLTTGFLLQHALSFYSALPEGGLALTRSIAGWLLTKAPERFSAGVLAGSVAGCRGKGLKFIQDALDPLVTGGWLVAETDFPSNNAWALVPGVREVFAERTKAEAERRAMLRALIRQGEALG